MVPNVQFEEDHISEIYHRPDTVYSPLVRFLVHKKIVKNSKVAYAILVSIIVVFLLVSLILITIAEMRIQSRQPSFEAFTPAASSK